MSYTYTRPDPQTNRPEIRPISLTPPSLMVECNHCGQKGDPNFPCKYCGAPIYEQVLKYNTPSFEEGLAKHVQVLESTPFKSSPKLNIRSGPGIDYPVVGHMDVGSFVYPIAIKDGWVKLYENKWVSARYVEYDKPNPIFSSENSFLVDLLRSKIFWIVMLCVIASIVLSNLGLPLGVITSVNIILATIAFATIAFASFF